jgi:hypothetical protein
MHSKKAQTAVELLTVYGWVVLIILIVLAMAYYSGYLNLGSILPPDCTFTPTMSCSTFKFGYMPDGKITALNFKLTNGLGYDIAFDGNAVVLTAENVGKLGENNYTGNCSGPPSSSIIRQGDSISCTVVIPDTDVVPSTGKRISFKLAVTYRNCNAAPNYVASGKIDCGGAPSYTVRGMIRTQLEPATTKLYGCGDKACDYIFGENPDNCCYDCPVATLVVIANPTSIPQFSSADVNVTARYGDGKPAANATINFTANVTPVGLFLPWQNRTNASGETGTIYGPMQPSGTYILVIANACGKTSNVTVQVQ